MFADWTLTRGEIMRLPKPILAVAVIAVLCAFATEARASGGGEACVVTSKTDIQGADKIRGSGVIVLRNFNEGAGTADSADATLTLTSADGTTATFRASVSNPQVVSAEEVMCEVLDADPKTSSGQTIFQAFGFPTPTGAIHDVLKLCLITRKLPNGQDQIQCQSISGLDFHQIGTTSDWSGSIPDLTIYRLR
jgi:hypothetical protein